MMADRIYFEIKGIENLKKRFKSFFDKNRIRKALFAMRNYIERRTIETFTKQGARDTHGKWKKFSPRTLRTPAGTARIRRYTSHKVGTGKPGVLLRSGVVRYKTGDQLLQSTGQGRLSFVVGKARNVARVILTGIARVEYGTKLDYMIAHHEGAGRLPKREILFISAKDKVEIPKIYRVFVFR